MAALPFDAEFVERLRLILGPAGLVMGDDLRTRHTRGIPPQPLQAQLLARPATPGEVADVVRACHQADVRLVPQGGLTGLVHGADAAPNELCLSLERLRRIEVVDPVQRVLVAEAGVTLAEAQTAAQEAGLMLPIDLGSRGSATLGGIVSTNAGGNRVLRHGMARDSVLGLEAVLADGTVLGSMNRLIKNNAGYDLKQLFIGSEGTLGIVTRVVLRLREALPASQVALLAVSDFTHVTRLLRHLDGGTAGGLTAFEVMWREFYQLVTTPPAMGRPPLGGDHPFYVLVEVAGTDEGTGERLMAVLGEAMDEGLVADATLAQCEREAEALWALRDDVEQLGRFGPPLAYDISLPLAQTGAYVEAARLDILRRWPDARVFAFGHLGDGNVHLIVHLPRLPGGADDDSSQALDRVVYGPLAALGGSISAEHGIGIEKKDWLGHSRTPAEVALMRQLKTCLDPKGLFNPGRVIEVQR